MKKLLNLLVLVITMNCLQAQNIKTYNVAIVVHEGVELFDFAGPGEVFAAASYFTDVVDFKVFTVAPNKGAVTSQTFLSINPTYSIEDAPEIDILVIPGGQTNVLTNDEKFMSWVEQRFVETENLLTVCTGAFVPAQLGLLDGLKATTHHSSIDALKRNYPEIEVIEHEKFIDNGKIITSGGVSSGTEGSLHMIHRLAGLKAAKKVARYMEYDHWKPNLGLVEYQSPFLRELKKGKDLGQITSQDIQKYFQSHGEVLKNPDQQLLSYGELEGLGYLLIEVGKIDAGVAVFQAMEQYFPPSTGTYESLGYAYEKAGKSAPATQEQFLDLIRNQGVSYASQQYQKWMMQYPDWMVFNEHSMNMLGYEFLGKDQTEEAIAIFELLVQAYPQSWNSWDSLAEACMEAGQKQEATAHYQRSLELNPENTNAQKMLTKMNKGS